LPAASTRRTLNGMRPGSIAVAVLLASGCSAFASTDTSELDPVPGGGADASHGVDAGGSGTDAGMPPPVDAGPVGRDAGEPPSVDAGEPPPVDAGEPRPRDAGPPVMADPSVPCGSTTCGAGESSGCCYAERADPYCYAEEHGTACECDGFLCWTTEVSCNGASDCPGAQRCCAFWGVTDEHPRRFVCAASCETSFGRAREMCDPADRHPCEDGATCSTTADDLPPGYGICE